MGGRTASRPSTAQAAHHPISYHPIVRPHPRIRKTTKYGGTALTVLLVAVWIGSGWSHWKDRPYQRTYLEIENGCVVVGRLDVFRVWTIWGRPSFALRWRPYYYVTTTGWEAALPLWIPLTLAFGATALAFRLDHLARRRNRMNLCPKCHYDLTGLPGGATTPCPECGTPGSSPKGGGMFIAQR